MLPLILSHQSLFHIDSHTHKSFWQLLLLRIMATRGAEDFSLEEGIAAKIQRSHYHLDKKSNEMELLMGFYTNAAGVRVLFVVGMCGEQTYEVGKRNADLTGLGYVFKRSCGGIPRQLVDGIVQRTYDAIKEGWYLLPEPGKSIQPKAKLIRNMINKGVFNKKIVWSFPQVEYTREQAAHILNVLKIGRGSLDVTSFEDDTAADF